MYLAVPRQTHQPEIPWVDFCCSGEGETTVYPLFSALLNGTDYTQIPGLVYRTQDTIVENPDPVLWEDLDTLPDIDFDLIPSEIMQNTYEKKKMASIEAGRGCPFNCAYCSSSVFWKRKFRIKSAKRIVQEMLDYYNGFGISRFLFEHDLFTVNKKKLLSFTDALKELDTKFQWACSARVDTLDEETITAMAETGLVSIFLGIETGSERMQKCINKNLKISDIREKIALLVKNKIYITASFIYAFPEETEEDLEQTLQLAYQLYKMGVSSLQFHLCVIFPGTDYYKRYSDQLVISETQSNIVGDFGFEECSDFIHEHQKLFSFCYEYPSPLRTKYAPLGRYVKQIFRLYDNFATLFPNQFSDKKFTEFSQEIIDLHDQNPDKHASEIGREYAMQYLPGVEEKKIQAVLKFYSDLADMGKTPGFTETFNTYPIDIAALLEKKPLEDIAYQETMVYFTKQDGKIFPHVLS